MLWVYSNDDLYYLSTLNCMYKNDYQYWNIVLDEQNTFYNIIGILASKEEILAIMMKHVSYV